MHDSFISWYPRATRHHCRRGRWAALKVIEPITLPLAFAVGLLLFFKPLQA